MIDFFVFLFKGGQAAYEGLQERQKNRRGGRSEQKPEAITVTTDGSLLFNYFKSLAVEKFMRKIKLDIFVFSKCHTIIQLYVVERLDRDT